MLVIWTSDTLLLDDSRVDVARRNRYKCCSDPKSVVRSVQVDPCADVNPIS